MYKFEPNDLNDAMMVDIEKLTLHGTDMIEAMYLEYKTANEDVEKMERIVFAVNDICKRIAK